ncbi:MAG TPA: hypothetical protein VHO26_13470 [Propionibacteriaceae bacterium]|nr:hypothetical protein [Propionibacteriaceae bacterium]
MTRARSSLEPRLVVQTWLASRGLVLLALLIVLLSSRRRLSDALSGWDVQHFLAIARDGYADPQNMAFFPALPAVMGSLAVVGVPPLVTGELLALIGSALAAWALYRLGGVLPAVFWLIAPMTVFTAVPYTEAPFAAAAFWAWERALSRNWLQAALLAAIACAFRVSGVFLVVALVVLALYQKGRSLPRLVVLLLPTAVVLGYLAFLHGLTGSWTAWFDAQSQGWSRRGIHSPVDAFLTTLAAAHPSYWPPGQKLVAVMFACEIVTVALGTATTIWCLVRREWPEAAFVGTQVLVFATSYWWMSSNRALLLWFPLFLLLADLATRRPRSELGRLLWTGFVAVAVAASCVSVVGWSWLFFSGHWAS